MTAWPAALDPVLTGRIVRLEPLDVRHADGLFAASRDPAVWRWIEAQPVSREAFDAWFGRALDVARAGAEAPFATVRAGDGAVVGSTRFLALRPADRGVEIGWTFLAPEMWRTGANVEAKLLMLTHAFDALRCLRVELKTHESNARSRGAMLALGATFEGIHRKHRVIPGVGIRDTAWYSIVDDEWPAVRTRLQARLAAARGASTRASTPPPPSSRRAPSP